ncbi:Retrovirus-related Pol polyprotein from transposon TNT 1-94 [Dendrobium catenatum]|uniref:Retrovirus-related Pol polyprotein from transposon TNT 1-94 n=1 Tax=Dendrobium catenatum TaxID=906689 RepID=A0A2I0VM01_9ASPA|nr:Retrovirus-related Pol polyprotein from transposon TNT 1-94 [Dendrobium catenatum]
MTMKEWEVLDQITLGLIQLSLSLYVLFNIVNEMTTFNLMVELNKMYEKPSDLNKVFLMKKLFNINMLDNTLMVEHLNNLNTVMIQLCLVGIKFDDEVRPLMLLSSLQDSLDGWLLL